MFRPHQQITELGDEVIPFQRDHFRTSFLSRDKNKNDNSRVEKLKLNSFNKTGPK